MVMSASIKRQKVDIPVKRIDQWVWSSFTAVTMIKTNPMKATSGGKAYVISEFQVTAH